MLSVKEPTEGVNLENEPSLTTDIIITSPSLGDGEEVISPSVQPTNIDPSNENSQVVTPPIEVVAPNSRQILLPLVPSFTATELGHGLAHSILSLGNADDFEKSLVYGKRAR